MKHIKHLILIFALMHLPNANADDPKTMVTIGKDGKLHYAKDSLGNSIPDFSRSGYMGGGVKIPDVPVRRELLPSKGEDDDTERIQKAIDELSKEQLDSNGFRGALLLKRGTYHVKGTLHIKASGIVLRGEGQGPDGTIIIATGTEKRTLIKISTRHKISEMEGSRREISDPYVPWGSNSLRLKSVSGYNVGDKIIVHRNCTQNWLDEIRMSNLNKGKKNSPIHNWTVDGYQFKFERVVTGIEEKEKEITLDAPMVFAIDKKFGGGYVYKYEEEKGKERLSQNGIEHIRLVSDYDKKIKDDEKHAYHGVEISAVNSWARNVTAVHFVFSAVTVNNGKFVTVQDCAYLKPVSKRVGGRRYPFCNNGQLTLFQRCYSEGGRHCNVAGARTAGPNVFLDCFNRNGDSGPHHRWAMGALHDNIDTHKLVADNRGTLGSGHGWTGATMVFWNCNARLMVVAKPPTAQNYVIGCSGDARGGGYYESVGKRVDPRSLYLTQLEERLGIEAVKNVTTESQRKGKIFDEIIKSLNQ